MTESVAGLSHLLRPPAIHELGDPFARNVRLEEAQGLHGAGVVRRFQRRPLCRESTCGTTSASDSSKVTESSRDGRAATTATSAFESSSPPDKDVSPTLSNKAASVGSALRSSSSSRCCQRAARFLPQNFLRKTELRRCKLLKVWRRSRSGQPPRRSRP